MPVSISLDPREDAHAYRRSLDLQNAISTVTYQKDGKITSYKIRSQEPTDVKVRIHGGTITLRTEKL